jgi:hypothetical protein
MGGSARLGIRLAPDLLAKLEREVAKFCEPEESAPPGKSTGPRGTPAPDVHSTNTRSSAYPEPELRPPSAHVPEAPTPVYSVPTWTPAPAAPSSFQPAKAETTNDHPGAAPVGRAPRREISMGWFVLAFVSFFAFGHLVVGRDAVVFVGCVFTVALFFGIASRGGEGWRGSDRGGMDDC